MYLQPNGKTTTWKGQCDQDVILSSAIAHKQVHANSRVLLTKLVWTRSGVWDWRSVCLCGGGSCLHRHPKGGLHPPLWGWGFARSSSNDISTPSTWLGEVKLEIWVGYINYMQILWPIFMLWVWGAACAAGKSLQDLLQALFMPVWKVSNSIVRSAY